MDKKALIKALRDTVQSASNTVASGVSAPVDLIAAGLRKVGLPIPQAPVGGSQWMENMGLTVPVEDGIPKLAGETLGMIVPMAATAKAPQIAAAANRGLENLAAPRTLNTPGYGGQRGAVGFVYPQQEALDIAQRNAAKPVSEGGLGLPPNNTAMDRAKAMGFDADLLHGTDKELLRFEPNRAITKDHGWYGHGAVYLTPDPNAASAYSNWKNVGAGTSGKMGQELHGQNVMPLMVRRGNVFDYGDAPPIMDRAKAAEFSAQVKGLGFNTVEVPNKYAAPEYAKNYETVVFDPSRIRSRFAAFDPARINENNLLGYADPRLLGLLGLGTAGGIGAYNYMQGK